MSATRPTSEQMTVLSGWIVEALELMPYMSHILFALRPFNSTGTQTFACDDKYRLYINFDQVVGKFSNRFCAEALLHECAHLFSDDLKRADEAGIPLTQDARRMWNRAADSANNDDLVEAGCAELGEYGVLAEQFGAERHLTAEQYYNILMNQESQQESRGSSGDDWSGGSDDGEDDGGCGSASGYRSVAEDDETGDPGIGDIERDLKNIATAGEIRSFAEKNPGKVPAGIMATAVATLAPPVVPWRRVLAGYIRRAVASRAGDEDITFNRRNRRRPTFNGMVMPGTSSPLPTVVVVRDTSGSIDKDMFDKSTSEIVGIAKQIGIRGDQLVMLDVDAEVSATVKYRGASSVMDRAGYGGTNMCVGIEKAKDYKPSVIVVLTDGYTPWPTERTGAPLIVCLVDRRNDLYPIPEWARVVQVEKDTR